jgi:hypothetical protein
MWANGMYGAVIQVSGAGCGQNKVQVSETYFFVTVTHIAYSWVSGAGCG